VEEIAPKEPGEEKPPRPVAVWVAGTIAYGVIVALLGLVLLESVDPEYSVFPPLLTALAGLFVATAINVRPGILDDDGADWNRFQTHVIVVAVTSMVLSIGLVMSAIAFPGEEIARTAFWGSAIAILIGASFLLATVWNRLSAEEPAPAVITPVGEGDKPADPLTKTAKEAEKENAAPTVKKADSAEEKKSPKKVKKRKKSGKKKPKKKDSKKKN
jgi:hypothetical protein